MKFLILIAILATVNAMSIPPQPSTDVELECPKGTEMHKYAFAPKTGVLSIKCCDKKMPKICSDRKEKLSQPAIETDTSFSHINNKIDLTGLSKVRAKTFFIVAK